MKKIFILAVVVGLTTNLFAQHTTPRTGTGANNDNTFRAATFGYKAITDATGNDTVAVNLNAYTSHIPVALTDTVVINLTPVTKCYLGDKAYFTVTNTSGAGVVKFIGSNVESADGSSVRLDISSTKRGNIALIFDGVKWVELSRLEQ